MTSPFHRRFRSRKPAFDRLEDRTVPSTIQGTVFNDLNGDGVRQAGEPGLVGWTVFRDTNRNGVLDSGETSSTTDSNGVYAFTGVNAPGDVVSLVLPFDQPELGPGRWLNTTPSYAGAPVDGADTTVVVRDFGVQFHNYQSSVPAGTETLVNTTVAGAQRLQPDMMAGGAVAADAQGNYAVVWRSSSLTTGGPDTITARLFNSDGSPRSGEIVVGSATVSPNGSYNAPVIDMASNGTFAVAWTAYSSSYATNAVYTRVYSASGSPVTSAVTVVAASKSVSNAAEGLAMDAAGDFVVLYKGSKASGPFWDDGITGFQRYNALGQPQGKAVQVVNTSLINGDNSIACDDQGNFVVTYDEANINNPNPMTVYAQRYSNAGAKVGSLIAVTPSSENAWQGSVAMNGAGQFVVAYFDRAHNVHAAQKFTAAGARAGGEQIFATGAEDQAGVAIDGAGAVTFTWDGGDRGDVHFRNWTAAGVLEADLLVNTTTQGTQSNPSVALTGNGSFVIVWSGYGAGDDQGVFAQRFVAASTTMATTSAATTAGTTTLDASLIGIDPSDPLGTKKVI